MNNEYKHLQLSKEERLTPRRKKGSPKFVTRADRKGHGQKLNAYFATAIKEVKKQTRTSEGKCVLKLRYEGALSFNKLDSHGVTLLSHEDNDVCLVFSNEEGLKKFQDHLYKLGIDDKNLSNRQVLEAISGIECWTEEDRKSWALKHKGLPPTAKVQLDIELWPLYFSMHPLRNSMCKNFRSWLATHEIDLVDEINLDSLVMYRVEANHNHLQLLLNHSDVRLVDLIPSTGISLSKLTRTANNIPSSIPSPPDNAPKVCILDSGISTNHPLLAPAIAESESFVDGLDAFDAAGHGTAVAGIALYGDLEYCNELNEWTPTHWLYNGKILDDNADFDVKTIENTLIDSVQYFQDLGCKIFNISIGNLNAPYDGKHIRGISYVLDKLARKYDILFIISTGNFSGSDNPPIPVNSWREEYPDYLGSDSTVIIDPAPSLNSLTVGSIARHNATIDSQRYPEIHQLSPASEGQPSPFTRHGPSVKGAIKPDLVAVGGNLAAPMRQESQQYRPILKGLGVLTCNNTFSTDGILAEVSGTSFSTPYITYLAARFLNEYPNASANTIRAALVNRANIPPEIEKTFSEEFKGAYKAKYKRNVTRDVSGYGSVEEDYLYRSAEDSVLLMVEESIENDKHLFFEIPVPDDFLRTENSYREIRVSLSYMPAVKTTRIEYRTTKISFTVVKSDSIESVQNSFNQSNKKTAALMSEVDRNRQTTSELRNKGTVQSSTWAIKQPRTKEKWFIVVTRQDFQWAEDLCADKEEFALVVSVSDRENEDARLYEQIKQRLRDKARLRA